jgi:protein-L-isoaspartate O-methyltransferase/glycosyltransferase involved in cell wall biosynthesis
MNTVSVNDPTAIQDHHGVVLLATLGERQTIRYVLEEVAESIRVLEASKYQFEVLIVDDSRDSEFNDHVNEAFDDLCISGKVIDGPKNGLGGAIVFGFETVLADPTIGFVVNLDADGQHDARQMPDLVRAHFATQSSITIGSRWTKGGTAPGLSWKRKVISKVSAAMLHRVGVPIAVKDPTTSFRVYGRTALKATMREVIDFKGYAFFGGVIACAASNQLKISEVPIRFRPRWAGESKMKLARIVETAAQLWSIGSRSAMIKRRNALNVKFGMNVISQSDLSEQRHRVMVCAEANTADSLIGFLGDNLTGDVLEVGAGYGVFSRAISKSASSLTSVEPNRAFYSDLEKQLEDIDNAEGFCGTLSEFVTSNGNSEVATKFDRVMYTHVLEHIPDDVSELILARQQLRPNGKAIIVVPSLPRLYGPVDSLSGHQRRFTFNELKSLAVMAGFEVESMRYFNPIAIVPYWILYRVIGVKSVGSGQLGLYDRLFVPLAYKMMWIFGGRIPGINLIAVLRVPRN